MTADSFTTGRQRERYYVCLAYHNKGRAVCANGQRLPMREADAAVLEKLRSYVLHPYRMVKDHRTNTEVGNADAVLDGDLDAFIDAYLRQQAGTGSASPAGGP